MARPLKNYLRTFRKRSCFSMREVAFLLGRGSSSAVGRHERFGQMPTIEALFAYEIVFGRPARELFRGLYAEIERQTTRRALELALELGSESADQRSKQKADALRAIYVPCVERTERRNDESNQGS